MSRSTTSNQWCFKEGHLYKLITSTIEGETTKWWQRWRRRLNTCRRLHSKGDHWLCQVQNTSDFPTELQFLLARGEIHVMTGLNKDKDKDKRSGEARVSDVFDCISLLLHIANICDGCCKFLWLVELFITVSCKPGEQFLLGVQPSLRPLVGGLQKRAQWTRLLDQAPVRGTKTKVGYFSCLPFGRAIRVSLSSGRAIRVSLSFGRAIKFSVADTRTS